MIYETITVNSEVTFLKSFEALEVQKFYKPTASNIFLASLLSYLKPSLSLDNNILIIFTAYLN